VFVLFGREHIAALIVVGLTTVIAVTTVRRGPAEWPARGLRAVLLATLPTLWVAENAMAWAEGWLTLQIGLPLQLCDVALVLAFTGLITLDRRPVGPLYFLALSGTVPALLTPELDENFPGFRFLIYFVPHGLSVLSTFVLVLGYGLVPERGAWRRTFVLLCAYAAFIGVFNWTFGTNFLYLAGKPRTATPFDWFGPWPWYILTLMAGFFCVFFLLDLPLRRLRRQTA